MSEKTRHFRSWTRTGLGSGERNVLVPDHDFKLLSADSVRLGPERVVFLHYFGVLDDSFELLHHALMHVSFLPDHRVVLVIRVVGIAELAIRTELKLEELVPELSLVSDVKMFAGWLTGVNLCNAITVFGGDNNKNLSTLEDTLTPCGGNIN
ncbi:Protein of unknown function, partial [Cotesia congregata]